MKFKIWSSCIIPFFLLLMCTASCKKEDSSNKIPDVYRIVAESNYINNTIVDSIQYYYTNDKLTRIKGNNDEKRIEYPDENTITVNSYINDNLEHKYELIYSNNKLKEVVIDGEIIRSYLFNSNGAKDEITYYSLGLWSMKINFTYSNNKLIQVLHTKSDDSKPYRKIYIYEGNEIKEIFHYGDKNSKELVLLFKDIYTYEQGKIILRERQMNNDNLWSPDGYYREFKYDKNWNLSEWSDVPFNFVENKYTHKFYYEKGKGNYLQIIPAVNDSDNFEDPKPI